MVGRGPGRLRDQRVGGDPGYLPGPVDPGTWQVVLGPYTVAPQGLAWEVEVSLAAGPPGPAFVPDPAPERAAGRGRAWYRGDLHTHTVHSDGRRTPAELAAEARAAGLDFVASTEHNTTSASLGWGAHAGPDLLVVDGQEVTTRDGHWLALGPAPGSFLDWRYRAADGVLDRVVAGLRAAGGLAVAAHPFCPFPGCAWRFGYEGVDAVEVWNGPWTPDDEAALAAWDRLLAARAAPAASCRRWPAATPTAPPTGSATPTPSSWPTGWTGGRCCRRWPRAAAGWPRRQRSTWSWRRPPAAGWPGSAGAWTPRPASRSPSGCGSGRGRRPGPAPHRRRDGAGGPLAGDDETVGWTTTAAATAWVRAEVRRKGAMVALTNPVLLGPAEASGRPPA